MPKRKRRSRSQQASVRPGKKSKVLNLAHVGTDTTEVIRPAKQAHKKQQVKQRLVSKGMYAVTVCR